MTYCPSEPSNNLTTAITHIKFQITNRASNHELICIHVDCEGVALLGENSDPRDVLTEF